MECFSTCPFGATDLTLVNLDVPNLYGPNEQNNLGRRAVSRLAAVNLRWTRSSRTNSAATTLERTDT